MAHNRTWTKEEDSQGKAFFAEGKSVAEIAGALNRSKAAVISRRKTWDVAPRKAAVPSNPFFFDTWTPESAYVLGFIITDGHVRRDLKCVVITQSHAHGRQHLLKIQERTGGSIQAAANDSYRLNIMSSRAVRKIHSLGVPAGDKSAIVEWPRGIPPSLLAHFVRGVFDGDGHVTVYTRRRDGQLLVVAGFTTGSEKFAQGLRAALEGALGICGSLIPVMSKRTGGTTWQLKFSVADSFKLLDWMYGDVSSGLYLEKKRELFAQGNAARLHSVINGQKGIRKSSRREYHGYPSADAGFSEFDPAIAEGVVRELTDVGDLVVDPFAGWGTRCEACLRLGRVYHGYEISAQAYGKVLQHLADFWQDSSDWKLHCADGCKLEFEQEESARLIFTSPPYWNMEPYEPAENQLANCPTYDLFLERMAEGVVSAVRVLKKGGYCAFVVAPFRHKGEFLPFDDDLAALFRKAGLVYHDKLIRGGASKSFRGVVRNAENRVLSGNNEVILVFQKRQITHTCAEAGQCATSPTDLAVVSK